MTCRRERAAHWPIFDGLSLPDDVGVLSIEMARAPSETMEAAVARAAGERRLALANSSIAGHHKLGLLVAGRAVRTDDRVAALNSARLGLWARWRSQVLWFRTGLGRTFK